MEVVKHICMVSILLTNLFFPLTKPQLTENQDQHSARLQSAARPQSSHRRRRWRHRRRSGRRAGLVPAGAAQIAQRREDHSHVLRGLQEVLADQSARPMRRSAQHSVHQLRPHQRHRAGLSQTPDGLAGRPSQHADGGCGCVRGARRNGHETVPLRAELHAGRLPFHAHRSTVAVGRSGCKCGAEQRCDSDCAAVECAGGHVVSVALFDGHHSGCGAERGCVAARGDGGDGRSECRVRTYRIFEIN